MIWHRRSEHPFDWAVECPELVKPGGHVRRVRPYRATLVIVEDDSDKFLEVCELVGIDTIAVDADRSG